MVGRSAEGGGGGRSAEGGGGGESGGLKKDLKTRTTGSQVGTMAETEPRAARWGQWQRSDGGERGREGGDDVEWVGLEASKYFSKT